VSGRIQIRREKNKFAYPRKQHHQQCLSFVALVAISGDATGNRTGALRGVERYDGPEEQSRRT
jgi:hypothetical protein